MKIAIQITLAVLLSIDHQCLIEDHRKHLNHRTDSNKATTLNIIPIKILKDHHSHKIIGRSIIKEMKPPI